MCGVGILYSEKPQTERETLAEKMKLGLNLRGPDSSGTWSHKQATLFHTRLAIIDLSPAGHQPMLSQSGRWAISYNGEIYNFSILKKQLEQDGIQLKGYSDSEVLVEMLDKYGIESTLSSIRGMFAIIAYDTHYNKIYLSRDRVGEKPLYYGYIGKDFVAGSDLRVFRPHPQWKKEINPEALNLYSKYNYVPDPYCIFKNIKKVMPGTFVKIDAELNQEQVHRYWSLPTSKQHSKWELDESKTFDLIEEELDRIIVEQMVSDAPLGSFLSGGIDSSLVTALMQKNSSKPINTFTIGFNEKVFDESQQAKEIAQHLGCHHSEWIISPKELQLMVPKMPEFYSEPFADSSQIPTSLLAQLTRQKVTVCLSGDGGDELFGGYNRYIYAHKVYNYFFWLPSVVRTFLGLGMRAIPEGVFNFIYSKMRSISSSTPNLQNPYQKLNKLSELMGASNRAELYDFITREWIHPEHLLLNTKDVPLFDIQEPFENYTSFMIKKDYQFYLPNDILTKVDRATMGSSLESRAPYLDYKLMELVHNIPLSMRVHKGETKRPMKSILKKYVPEKLFNRPKMGFGVPIADWLRDDLGAWTKDLLSEERLRSQNIYNSKFVTKVLNEHLSGKRNNHFHLWNLLMFQQWYDQWMD